MRYRVALAVLLLAGCGGGHSSRLSKSLEPVLAGGVPGAFVYVRDGSRTQAEAVGLSDVDARVALRPDARFRVGSVTKTFVATVVLQLAAEGKLGLDDPVSRWLPGLLADGSRITIRDLLAHRSGLADVADDPRILDGSRSNWAPRRLIELVARQPRTARPGGAFRYSSTNYLVLGLIVERATGRSVGSELTRRIIAPLHLADTTYTPGPIDGPHVHGYSLPSHQGVVDASAEPRDLEALSARWAGASGDLVSTAADVSRFLAQLLGGRVLPPAQLRELESVRDRYGLGLAARPTPCGRAWGHTGNLNGVLTIAWSTRDGRRQVVLVANEYPLTAAADTELHRAAVVAFCRSR